MKKFNILFKVLGVVLLLIGIAYLTKSPSYPGAFEVQNITKKINWEGKQNFSGATLVNLDEDSEQEIFISGHGVSNLLLKHQNDSFIPLHIPELLDAEGLTFSVTACDLDEDGRDEILILNRPDNVNNASHSRIMKYADKKWTDIIVRESLLVKQMANGYSATCIDRTGKGKYGLAITSEEGDLMYLESINSEIKNVAAEIGLGLKSKGRSILGIPGPTGHTNIFVGNEGDNFFFRNQGDGTFKEIAKEIGLTDSQYRARGIGIIDINHDDIPDIVYGNHFGPTRLFEQHRDGSFKDVTPEDIIKSYAVNSAVVGDFNLDGFEDLYLNNIRSDNKLFSRSDKRWYELDIDMLEEKEMYGISTIAGDLDQNGSFEILNTHGDGSHFPVTLYTIRPASSWIKFSVKYESGVIPRGAIIKLRTTSRDLVRVISTGSGRFANYDSDVIFGLTGKESPLSLEVTLPSGKKAVFEKIYELSKLNQVTVPNP